MISTPIKVGIAIIGLASVTTGSYFINDYYSTERIFHTIADEGKTLLSWSDKNEEWLKRWKEYVNNNRGKDIWNLNNYEKDKLDQNKVPNSFKNKCLYSTSTAVEGNEKLATEIEKYCTKSFKLADLINAEKGIKLIQKNDTKALNDVWGKYFDHKNKAKVNPLDIKSSVHKDKLPDEYIENCNKKSNQEIRTKRDRDYLIVKNWCSKSE